MPVGAVIAAGVEDALDAGEIDAFFLRQPLHGEQLGDVTRGVTTAAPTRATGRHEPEPVVLPQCLRVHAGKLRRDRDDEDGGVIRGVNPGGEPAGRHGLAHRSPPVAAYKCARGSACSVPATASR